MNGLIEPHQWSRSSDRSPDSENHIRQPSLLLEARSFRALWPLVSGAYELDIVAGLQPQESRLTARSRALSELAAGLAERDDEVVQFRDEALGGKVLTSEEAEEFPTPVSLSALARRLARLFDWKETEAVHFVLTGETPQVRPLEASVTAKAPPGALTQRSITLTAASWIPAKVVERTYRQLQREIISGRNRGPEAHCWEVAGFVLREERRNGRLPWPVLLERWHQEHPDKPFKSPDRFHECFRRAARAMVPLPFKLPEPKTYEKKVAEARAREERIKRALAAHAEKTNNAPLFEG